VLLEENSTGSTLPAWAVRALAARQLPPNRLYTIIPQIGPLVGNFGPPAGRKSDKNGTWTMERVTREQFLKHLRDALGHLRDPERLRQSPLAALLGVAGRFDTFSALQCLLAEGIESMEPAGQEPSSSRAWRIYESLFYRYVQGFSQQEVAEQLGISVRHLRREQHVAIEALADRLWQQFGLEARLREAPAAAAESPPGVAAGTSARASAAEEDVPTVNAELAWLQEGPADTPADLGQVLPAVTRLAQALADRHGVSLDVPAADALPVLAAHPVAINQALLNVLGVAIHRAPGGRVSVSVCPEGYQAALRVRADKPAPGVRPLSEDDAASLDMARRLAELCGGHLESSEDERTYRATLVLPFLEQLPVLAIDDNADTLQLLQRYAAGTRYRLIGTRDPEQALSLAAEIAPQIVVLDVMMPQVDGWQVLGRLQQHPLTAHIPIVVCTILAQEELALSLGASAFARKPLKRQAFLETLDRVLQEGRGSG
jgi:CheY-like chemotaxis protein